jgi:hypothetical protein
MKLLILLLCGQGAKLIIQSFHVTMKALVHSSHLLLKGCEPCIYGIKSCTELIKPCIHLFLQGAK